jgi:hypothetical protein
VKSAASGKCSHHLLLSWGNSHHRRKTQYIGGLIYGYCLSCCKLFIYGIISITQRDQPDLNKSDFIILTRTRHYKYYYKPYYKPYNNLLQALSQIFLNILLLQIL